MSIRVAAVVAAGLALVGASHAQCTYSTSLLAWRDSVGLPSQGDQQQPGVAWTFHRSDQNRALLTGVTTGNVGAWGAANQSFFVPLAGPRISPFPARNELPFFRRTPSFEGIFFHPGYSPIDLLGIFQPTGSGILTSCTLQAEDLGTASPNVVVSVDLESPSGTTNLIPATSVASLAAAITRTTPPGMSYAFNQESRIVVRSNNGGDPSEDWLNLNVTLNFQQAQAVILRQPQSYIACPGTAAAFDVVDAGATQYRWFRAPFIPLSDGPTPTGSTIVGAATRRLQILGAQQPDAGQYFCIVTNACQGPTSTSATLTVLACCPDLNQDGVVDQGDIDYLINIVAGGSNPTGVDPDFNRDGVADQGDIDSLINVVAGGECP